MKNLIISSVLVLFLSACQTINPTVTITKFQKIDVPSQFLDCDGKKIVIPDPSKLTNKQIVKYIVELNVLVEECQGDVSAIKKYIERYNAEVDKTNERSKNDKI